MVLVFNLLYLILIIGFVWAALCIVFHIVHYSLSRSRAGLGVLLFAAVASVLLFTNILLFFSLPLERILSQTYAL